MARITKMLKSRSECILACYMYGLEFLILFQLVITYMIMIKSSADVVIHFFLCRYFSLSIYFVNNMIKRAVLKRSNGALAELSNFVQECLPGNPKV